MKPPLHYARLKVERAKKHIAEMNEEISRFCDAHLHIPFIEHDPDGPGDLLKIGEHYEGLDSISMILGDVIHNLRCALDLAISDIERTKCGKNAKYTKFPVYESRNEFVAAIKGGLEQKVPWHIFNRLLVDIQPYRGGYGESLVHLHNLDIEDKHRGLLDTTYFGDISGIRIRLDDGREVELGNWRLVRDRVAAHCITGNRNVQITNEGNATFDIKFGEGLPFDGESIVPTCTQLSQFVSGIVEELARIMRVLIDSGDLT